MKFSESMFDKPFMAKEFGNDKHTIYKFEKINNHINVFMLLPDFKGKKIWKNRCCGVSGDSSEWRCYHIGSW